MFIYKKQPLPEKYVDIPLKRVVLTDEQWILDKTCNELADQALQALRKNPETPSQHMARLVKAGFKKVEGTDYAVGVDG